MLYNILLYHKKCTSEPLLSKTCFTSNGRSTDVMESYKFCLRVFSIQQEAPVDQIGDLCLESLGGETRGIRSSCYWHERAAGRFKPSLQPDFNDYI